MGVDVHFAAAHHFTDQVHQRGRQPARLQADADRMSGVCIQLEGDGRLAAGSRAGRPFRDNETDGLQVVGDIRDRLGTQGNLIDDFLARNGALATNDIENDAPVIGRA